jgi:hypothetical protein
MAENKKNKVWMYVGIGCAGLLLLVIATCVGVGFYAKRKMDQAGGPQAFATQMISMGGGIIALPALPESEREDAKKVLADLQAKAKNFNQADIKELSEAMDRLGKAQKASPDRKPSADDARAFIAECKRIADKH